MDLLSRHRTWLGQSFRLNMQGYDQARTLQFQENLRQRIAGMPGVTSVSLATAMPLSNGVGMVPAGAGRRAVLCGTSVAARGL